MSFLSRFPPVWPLHITWQSVDVGSRLNVCRRRYNPGGYGTNEAHVISKKSLLHVPPPSQSNNPAPLTSHGLTSHAVSRRNSTSSAPLNVTLRRNNVGSASFSTRFASGRERALPAASHPTRPPFGVTKITKVSETICMQIMHVCLHDCI